MTTAQPPISTGYWPTIRRVAVFVLFIAALALAYTGFKSVGSSIDDAWGEWPLIGQILPRSDDVTMPPISAIVAEAGHTPRGNDLPFGLIVATEAIETLTQAGIGFLAGIVAGLAIAMLLDRSEPLEKGFLPYVIASQTIPLVAIAPIVVIWGRKNLGFLPGQWTDRVSVALIATFLTFFPVAVNGLRGLQSPKPEDTELMRSYAAGWWPTMRKLKLPAALPYLFAAFKIAATASVVGAIVGEISAGVDGGLGRRILLEAQRYSTGPERLYVAVVGAASTGIFVFLLITGVEYLTTRGRGDSTLYGGSN